ncbi:MAG: efflux RND transporter periplasmic adaptor subunit [Bacteroidales bacterium]|nr:efflux RND transporter periplasmic adaptor subunit [Bacteroidales bacterium]
MKKGFILLATSLFLSAACSSDKQKNAAGDNAGANVVEVKVADVKKQPVPQQVDFTGNIEPYVKNNISSAASQRVEKIMVEIGSRVRKGQLLVQMESLNYSQAKVQLENLKLDLARIEELYKAGGVAQQQYDQIKTQVNVAEQSIRNLDKNTKLLSPIDGVVTQRNYDNGDMVAGLPILVVMQIQPVKILINISEEYFPQVKVGTPVQITLDVYDGKTYSGKVSLVYPTIDPATRTFQAQVSISNPKSEIRPGMFARAKVNFGTKDRFVVPDKAVVKQSGTNDKYVYVLDGDVVKYTKVEVGKRVGSIYEIKSGLELGQKVVVAGLSRLVDQAKVKVVETGLDLTKNE